MVIILKNRNALIVVADSTFLNETNMSITDKNHLYHLIKFGVYFGYSTESIIEFVINFDNAYEEINEQLFDYRIKGVTHGTGHVCSWYEAITLSYEEISEKININRFCSVKFPWNDKIPFDKVLMNYETDKLFRTNYRYRKQVERILDYIIINFDVTLEQDKK